jgi:ubiquinone/menaquinone biosynthesis C-methylase UbiE
VKTDFSRVARAYRWMEYASFGTLLERTRFFRIAMLQNSRRALVLGDGDGRFLERLARANPEFAADSVDFSPGMIRLARSRVDRVGARVDWHQADALLWTPPHAEYDLIVTHFFLDCFSDHDVQRLIGRLIPYLSPGGMWINSDFAVPARGWMRWPSRIIIRGLYAAFFLLAGLRTQRLPDDVSALESAGLTLEHRDTLAGGLLKSEVWRKLAARSKTDP